MRHPSPSHPPVPHHRKCANRCDTTFPSFRPKIQIIAATHANINTYPNTQHLIKFDKKYQIVPQFHFTNSPLTCTTPPPKTTFPLTPTQFTRTTSTPNSARKGFPMKL